MWGDVWDWICKHYIYNAAVLLFIIVYIFNAISKTKGARKILGRFKKVKFGALEMELKDGDAEKDVQQDSAISVLEKELVEIRKRLDIQYQFIREAAIQAGNSVVWSGTGAPYMEVIKAGIFNISLGVNGNLKYKLLDAIIGFGKEGIPIYRSILNDFIKNANKEKLSAYFYETIKWIDDHLPAGENHE